MSIYWDGSCLMSYIWIILYPVPLLVFLFLSYFFMWALFLIVPTSYFSTPHLFNPLLFDIKTGEVSLTYFCDINSFLPEKFHPCSISTTVWKCEQKSFGIMEMKHHCLKSLEDTFFSYLLFKKWLWNVKCFHWVLANIPVVRSFL